MIYETNNCVIIGISTHQTVFINVFYKYLYCVMYWFFTITNPFFKKYITRTYEIKHSNKTKYTNINEIYREGRKRKLELFHSTMIQK